MLSGPQLSDLARRTRSLAQRYDQVRRDTIEFDVPADCPNTTLRAAQIDADAATLAELETLLGALRRAERESRPPTAARRQTLFDRTRELLGRPLARPDEPVRLTGVRS